MKFLCGNCKAKYQIADEKVSGKTLRMKCRRCGHDILIDGHNVPSSSPPAANVSGRRGGPASVVPSPARAGSGAQPLPGRPPAPGVPLPPRAATSRSKPPSALSTEFRRHIAAPPEVPQRAPYDLWHVAINDVPVGPMTREELGRKIEAGAVSADSLCWREGMDDWRPLGELPELAQLLRRGREASRSRPPPRHRQPPHVPPHVPAPQGARTPSHFPADIEELEEEYSEPTRIADLHSPAVAAAHAAAAHPAPAQGGTSPKIVLPPQAQIASAMGGGMGSTMDMPLPAPTRQGPGGMTTGLVIGLLGGILLVAGPMLYKTFWGGAPAASATQAPAEQPSAAQRPVEMATREVEVEAPAEPEKANPSTKTTKPPLGPGVRNTKTEPTTAGGKVLSPEELALLRRMGVEGGGGGVNLANQKPRENDGPSVGSGPALTPSQLSKVVQDNKVQLQRCYETALRAAGGRQEGTIKVTVAVTVGTSGMTKLATTQGSGLGNMNDCIKSAVKRWRFPQSGGESQFEFPLVFQPGA